MVSLRPRKIGIEQNEMGDGAMDSYKIHSEFYGAGKRVYRVRFLFSHDVEGPRYECAVVCDLGT
jgi:hypothetical protein